ncbi:helix-turn-helix domain-containing protein [Gehongia tenuis]|uniref:Helix-turn-helix transcriptional regulator n=1 Tax=Gehongia tenuis TaxID=2763655 RepID=A0A926HLH7_9FIRM|nr:helix-turn-helix transcriptional regulator [Gehongia tenuis]MBC8532082.1 helix-turn-helix transcriptional regulator [Gehongia tenuis]
MKIAQIIRAQRKTLGLTQEQVAERLGVSTSAVNKWERGGAYPDITLLSPLARLLHLDLNALLSFKEELTDQEIGDFLSVVMETIENEGFERGFSMVMDKIHQYPHCGMLIFMAASTLEGARMMFPGDDGTYEDRLEALYERAAASDDGRARDQAKGILLSKAMNKGEYEKAEKLLAEIPDPTLDKRQMKANLYQREGRLAEAAEILEGKVMNAANDMQSALLGLMDIALAEDRPDLAGHYGDVAVETARLYDLWQYNAYVPLFQLAVAKRDGERCMAILEKMLPAMLEPWDVQRSPLYGHVRTKTAHPKFQRQMLDTLLNALERDGELDFLRNQAGFPELMQRFKA